MMVLLFLSPMVTANPHHQKLCEFHPLVSERRKRSSSQLMSSSPDSLSLSTSAAAAAASREEASPTLPPLPPNFFLPKWRTGTSSSLHHSLDRKATSSLLKEKLMDEAVLCLERNVRRGLRPDYNECMELLHDLCASGNATKSVTVMELMVSSGKPPDMAPFTGLVSHLCSRGNLGHAMQVVNKMVACGCFPTQRTCNWLVRAFSTFGKLQRSLHLVEKLVRGGFIPDEFTYTILLEVACKEKGVDQAIRLLREIVAKGGRPNIAGYNVLLTGFCKEGRVEEALRLFRSLPSMGFPPSAISYNILLRRLCYDCDWDTAGQLLSEMATETRSEPNVITYSTLIAAFSFHGYVGQALEVLELIRTKEVGFYSSCYNPIVMHYSREGKTELVVAILDLMNRRGVSFDSQTFQAVALLCGGGEPGTEDKSEDALKLLQKLGKAFKGSSSMHNFYNDLLALLCREGETYVAFQLLQAMTLVAEFVPDSYTYSALLRGLCMEGMPEAALEIFDLMLMVQHEHQHQDCAAAALGAPNADHYDALLIGLCKTGRTDVAFDVFEVMVSRGRLPSFGCYCILLEGLTNENEVGLAEEILHHLHRIKIFPTHMMERISLQFDLELPLNP